jgi:hypothetical protein
LRTLLGLLPFLGCVAMMFVCAPMTSGRGHRQEDDQRASELTRLRPEVAELREELARLRTELLLSHRLPSLREEAQDG